MPPITPESGELSLGHFEMVARVITTQYRGATVLLNADRGFYFMLSETGARTWELLRQGESAEAIVRQLEREYDLPAKRVAADVAELVDRLLLARVIEPLP